MTVTKQKKSAGPFPNIPDLTNPDGIPYATQTKRPAMRDARVILSPANPFSLSEADIHH